METETKFTGFCMNNLTWYDNTTDTRPGKNYNNNEIDTSDSIMMNIYIYIIYIYIPDHINWNVHMLLHKENLLHLKQHFDTRYLVFYNTSPPRMFLSLELHWEYRIQHGANGPLYVTSNYSTWIFCRGGSGFATDCPCYVWCRGLTTCLLHVGPPFENRILKNSWAVGLT